MQTIQPFVIALQLYMYVTVIGGNRLWRRIHAMAIHDVVVQTVVPPQGGYIPVSPTNPTTAIATRKRDASTG